MVRKIQVNGKEFEINKVDFDKGYDIMTDQSKSNKERIMELVKASTGLEPEEMKKLDVGIGMNIMTDVMQECKMMEGDFLSKIQKQINIPLSSPSQNISGGP